MLTARAQFVRLFFGDLDIRRWQNYSIGNNITKSAGATEKYLFMPFDLPSGSETALISVSSLALTLPATADNTFVFSYALEQGFLCEIETYEFSADLGDAITTSMPVSKTLVSTYTGQVETVESDLNVLSVQIGTTQMATENTIPPRTYNNFLVGVPYAP